MHPWGWSVSCSPCGSYYARNCGNKIIVRCRPHCAWELNVQIPVLVLRDVCPNVPRGCGMNSGKSALESGFCGAQEPGIENRDSAGGTCSESQKKPFHCHQSSSAFYAVFGG